MTDEEISDQEGDKVALTIVENEGFMFAGGVKECSGNFKVELVEKFCHWLENQDMQELESQINTGEISLPSPDTSFAQIDLFTLFSELIALKQETKIASRQWKTGIDQWEKTSEFLQKTFETLQREQEQRRKEVAELKESLIRPLLQGVLDIYDRLEQGIKAIEERRPSSWLTRVMGGGKGFQEFAEGQSITLRHLGRLLASYEVTPIETVGKVFDPFRMRA
ncbi:MAG: nucleotide exchange factor GrpE, partial [bacterium]